VIYIKLSSSDLLLRKLAQSAQLYPLFVTSSGKYFGIKEFALSGASTSPFSKISHGSF